MLDEHLPVTLQYQLKQKLLERIRKGEWPAGSRISSEREFCEDYGVSRITVREALKDLVGEGLLVRKQGKGTFVAFPKLEQRLGSFYSFSDEIRKMGLNPQTKVLDFQTIPAEETVRTKLGLAPEEPVFCITRLRLVEDDPFAWEQSYIPKALAPGLNEEQVTLDGLYNALRSHAGLAADEAEEDFDAIACPAQAADGLEIKRGSPVLHLARLTKAGGQCVEYCDSIIRSDKYRYKVILK